MNQRITDCDKGKRCVIAKVHAKGSLKERLLSFGILRGVEIELLEFAPGKSTVEIKIGKMRIALRKEEAELIEVSCA
ncbi:MAG: ferrous iron transport protein A [Campylobacterales bacterium]|nr:ferrous iron transport protein A [Campylobacterales bacterium]